MECHESLEGLVLARKCSFSHERHISAHKVVREEAAGPGGLNAEAPGDGLGTNLPGSALCPRQERGPPRARGRRPALTVCRPGVRLSAPGARVCGLAPVTRGVGGGVSPCLLANAILQASGSSDGGARSADFPALVSAARSAWVGEDTFLLRDSTACRGAGSRGSDRERPEPN